MSVVIVGAGHAGGQVVASLRQLKYDGPITLIGSESYLPYQRPPLTKEYLRGEFDIDRVTLRPAQFYEKNSVDVVLGRRVNEIDKQNRAAVCEDGQIYEYDSLVLTTGSAPIKPPIPGIDLKGVHLLRTIEDVNGIVGDLREGKRAAVIGGGYIGLEAAASLRKLGYEVAVIEMEDRLLKRVATERMSKFFLELHKSNDTQFHLNSQVKEIVGDEDGIVNGLRCSGGVEIDVNLVIVGVGIRPEISLAESSGLKCENGVWVDEYCNTSDEAIFAAGDCTNHPNSLIDRRLRLESVPNAMEQARATASNVVGKTLEYASYPWFWSDQFDVKLQMVGFADGRDDSVVRRDQESDSFIEFHLAKGVLVGADAINSPKEFLAARRLMGKSLDIEQLGDQNVDLRVLIEA